MGGGGTMRWNLLVEAKGSAVGWFDQRSGLLSLVKDKTSCLKCETSGRTCRLLKLAGTPGSAVLLLHLHTIAGKSLGNRPHILAFG